MMNKYISKKLQIDPHNDSLLQQPSIKKFIGLSARTSSNSLLPIQNKNKISFKSFNPKVDNIKSNSRQKIDLFTPSSTRILFFTKYQQNHNTNQCHNKNLNPEFDSSRSCRSGGILQTSKILLSSFAPRVPNISGVGIVRRRLSLGTLKPKTEVDRMMKLRRRNIIQNPFLESARESEIIKV